MPQPNSNTAPATNGSDSALATTTIGPVADAPYDWQSLRLPKYESDPKLSRNANDVHEESLSRIDQYAMWVTDKVGSVGFFLLIFVWTVVWTGYNIAATEIPGLHWKSFDPFPAFVAYLLISNVIQILLMPLIMVGQNLQGRHTETRAELDFQINQKAEKEVFAIMRHLEHNTELLLQLMQHLDCRVSEEQTRTANSEDKLDEHLAEDKD